MILSSGKNEFKDHTYSFWDWSAPILQTYEEVIAAIKALKLEGRVIKSFYTVGMGYNWTDDNLGEAIYNCLERRIREGQLSPGGPFPFLPEGICLARYAEIDEPFLIEFEDGDILAIDFSEGSSLRMEMNTIPKDIHWGTNRNTFHPNALFSSLIGKEIAAVEVTASTRCKDFTGSHGLHLGEQDSYITKLSIVCRNSDAWELEKLAFSSFYDFGIVEVTDDAGAALTIHAPDIKAVVEGFIEEEILQLEDDYHFDD